MMLFPAETTIQSNPTGKKERTNFFWKNASKKQILTRWCGGGGGARDHGHGGGGDALQMPLEQL